MQQKSNFEKCDVSMKVVVTVCPRSLDLFYFVTYYMNGLRLLRHTVYNKVLSVQEVWNKILDNASWTTLSVYNKQEQTV